MMVVGLTGGIGAGKTTVSRILAELGAAVIDADQLARQVVEPGTEILRQVVQTFGPDVLDAAGRLNRGQLAQRVFADASARRRLERITHPAIDAAFRTEVARLEGANVGVVVYDAALLVETGRHRQVEQLIVVVADDDVRLARLQRREGIGAQEIRERMAAQLPQPQKAKLADFVIDNSGALAETRRQVERVWQQIRGGGQ